MSLSVDLSSIDRRFISFLLIVISVSMSMSAKDISCSDNLVSPYSSSMFFSFSYSVFIEWNFSFVDVSSFFVSFCFPEIFLICSFFSSEFFSFIWSMSNSFNFILNVDNFSFRRFIFMFSSSLIWEFFSISFFAKSIFSVAVVEILCLWVSSTSCLQIGQNFNFMISFFSSSSSLIFVFRIAFSFSFSKISFSKFDMCSVIVFILFSVSSFCFLFSSIDLEYFISLNSEVIVWSIN